MSAPTDDTRGEQGTADGGPRSVARITRFLLGGVAFAAGLVGVAMLVAPRSTGTYFSWALAPTPLAVLRRRVLRRVRPRVRLGGVEGVVDRAAWTVRRRARARRADPGGHDATPRRVRLRPVAGRRLGRAVRRQRVQLRRPRRPPSPRTVERRPLPSVPPRAWSSRVLGVAYAAVAVVLWAWPGAVSEHGPVAAGPLGLRFVGSWAAFLALDRDLRRDAPAARRGTCPGGHAGRVPAGHAARHRRPRRGAARRGPAR